MHQSFETPDPPTLGIPEVNQGQSLGFHPFPVPWSPGKALAFTTLVNILGNLQGYRRGLTLWSPYIEISN